MSIVVRGLSLFRLRSWGGTARLLTTLKVLPKGIVIMVVVLVLKLLHLVFWAVGDNLKFIWWRGCPMYLNNRGRAKLLLAAGIVGMVAQERLSLMSGGMLKSVALMTLAISIGLLLFAQGAAFQAGYEEAGRRRTVSEG